MVFFLIKIFISAILIAFVSWLADKKTVLAGFLTALPIISATAILFAYLEHRDMAKINKYAVSIFAAVPLSLAFFIPFLLNKWLKLNFTFSFLAGLGLLAVAYFLHTWLFKSG